MNSFTRTTDMLHRAMDVSTLRYQVTANNLANSEVPNYKSVEVNFESELKRDYLSTTKANGNNVDAETEAMNVLKIQLNYQLLTQLQTFEFSQVKSVLK